MKLLDLQLRHYRNYEDLEIQFNPGVNIFIGENAQGKTNLLEAIHVLALARSHRTNHDRELIQWQAKTAMLKGNVERFPGKLPLEIQINATGKRVKVNHSFQQRLSSYIGNLNVVLFAPEDLELVKGSPQLRRRFMDIEFGQMSSRYLYNISQYHRQLKQRNQYLKQVKQAGKLDSVLLGVMSDQLIASGAQIIHTRYQLIQQLETWAQELHQHISRQKETLTLKYVTQVTVNDQTTVEEIQSQLKTLLEKSQAREQMLGTTLVGPQRDDLQFLVNDQNVQKFGSQGQQRTTALSVKLAEIELMKAQTGEYPLLLLDDVLSELDDNRQTHLLTAIQDKVQTLLTTTSLDGVAKQLIQDPSIFRISHGQVSKE